MNRPPDPPKPRVQSIGSLVGQLISRRGYAQIAATDRFHEAIAAAVGKDLAAEVTARARHGQAVNLDPAALVLDTVFKMQETASR